MKSKNKLARKLERFYRDVESKREKISNKEIIKLQTDL